MTAVLKRAKSQNSAGSFGFLAVGMFIEVIYFRVGLCHTLSKFNIIFSKNPITQMKSVLPVVLIVPQSLVTLNVSKVSCAWCAETYIDRD